jgi:ubiquinone/menaquinone biosynthesis C-methylase UbiE
MSGKTEWIEEFFGGERDFYGNVYKTMGVFDNKDPEMEVDNVINLLKPEEGSYILDWCGGWGRHAIPLAKRGFKVTLLDFSAEYLERAKDYAVQEGVDITVVHSDFRYTPSSINADYAVNMFTAGLGYLGEENDLLALQSLYRSLKFGAKILIDTMSLFWMVRNFKENSWALSPNGDKRYLQKRVFDFWTNSERAVNTYQDIATKSEEVACVDMRVYSPADLARILREANFVPEKIYGSLDASNFTFDSKRLIMIANKP